MLRSVRESDLGRDIHSSSTLSFLSVFFLKKSVFLTAVMSKLNKYGYIHTLSIYAQMYLYYFKFIFETIITGKLFHVILIILEIDVE